MNDSKREQLDAPPPSLAVDGEIAFGKYSGEIGNLDTAAWDGKGMLSPRRLQRKAWIYGGLFSDQYMLGMAIVDAGMVATAFVYVYDRAKGVLVEEKVTKPFGFAEDHKPGLRAPWRLAGGGREWTIAPLGQGWRFGFSGRRIQLTLNFAGGTSGMSTVAASPGRAFHHTYKTCAIPASMQVTVDGHAGSAEGTGMIDFTLGYPPRRTIWNWASMTGRAESGESVGLNLVAHFNEGLENAIWIGDRIVPLSQAFFRYDATRLAKAPWRIETADGALQLTFFPDGMRAENLRLGVMESRFSQPFGRFEGRYGKGADQLRFSGFGVVEEHNALW